LFEIKEIIIKYNGFFWILYYGFWIKKKLIVEINLIINQYNTCSIEDYNHKKYFSAEAKSTYEHAHKLLYTTRHVYLLKILRISTRTKHWCGTFKIQWNHTSYSISNKSIIESFMTCQIDDTVLYLRYHIINLILLFCISN
jgi:hypothetical protein